MRRRGSLAAVPPNRPRRSAKRVNREPSPKAVGQATERRLVHGTSLQQSRSSFDKTSCKSRSSSTHAPALQATAQVFRKPHSRTSATNHRRPMRRGHCILTVAHPQFMAVAEGNLSADTSLHQDGPLLSAVLSPPKDACSPERTSSSRVYSQPGAGRRGEPLAASTSSRRVKPVPAFVVASCPAPPVNTQTRRPLPCSNLAGLSPTSTCGPLPDCGVLSTRETLSLAPKVPLPAATVLPSLAMIFIQPITLLENVTSRTFAPHVPGSRLGMVSAESLGDFWGPNTEASPYPPVKGVRDSAPSSAELTGKPFLASGLSWLRYSSSAV